MLEDENSEISLLHNTFIDHTNDCFIRHRAYESKCTFMLPRLSTRSDDMIAIASPNDLFNVHYHLLAVTGHLARGHLHFLRFDCIDLETGVHNQDMRTCFNDTMHICNAHFNQLHFTFC